MLKRNIADKLLAWKNNVNHKALLLDGAGQVGKTFSVRQFAKENYSVVLEINFVENPSAKAIFEGDLNAENIITGLTAFTNTPLIPDRTLILTLNMG